MTHSLGRIFLPALCLVCAALFAALGSWQVERRGWKVDLIERVEHRIAADPVPLPPRREWAALEPRDIEYRKVRATGRFMHDRETLVEALTELGPGYWVVTPLRMTEGVVLVNRGFVPPRHRAQATRRAGLTAGQVDLVGLLRPSETGGRFLRPNRPAASRWYSRDAVAIAGARRLDEAAPFFIDAGPAPNPGGYPLGGLTVTRFRNAHLIYALTWFGLAGLSLFGLAVALKRPGSKNNSARMADEDFR